MLKHELRKLKEDDLKRVNEQKRKQGLYRKLQILQREKEHDISIMELRQ
jgi:hypothetical protein